MSRKKKFLWIIGIFLTFLTFFIFLFSKSISELVAHELIKAARSQGVRLNVGTFGKFFPNVEAKDIDIWIGPFNLVFDTMMLEPHYRGLISGNMSGSAKAVAYGGDVSIDGVVSQKLISGTGELKNVHLELHPQISGLGLSSAIANLQIKKLSVVTGKIEALEGDINVTQIELHRIPTFGFPIALPPLSRGSLSASVKVGELAQISDILFSSSLGTLKGDFSISSPAIKLVPNPSANGTFECKLSPELLQAVGSFLPLISNNKLTATNSEFKINLNGHPCRGAQSPLRLAGLCTDVVFSPLASGTL